MNTSSEEIVERVSALESHNRRLRLALAATWVAAIAFAGIAASRSQAPELLRARAFELVDEQGSVLASIKRIEGATVLQLSEPGGTSEVRLASGPGTATVAMGATGSGNRRYSIGLTAEDANARIGLNARDGSGKNLTRIHIESNLWTAQLIAENVEHDYVAAMRAVDGASEVRLDRPVKPGGALLVFTNEKSALSLARDGGGANWLSAAVDSLGPHVSIYDPKGSVIAAFRGGEPRKADPPSGGR
jgi:hypothetical protein